MLVYNKADGVSDFQLKMYQLDKRKKNLTSVQTSVNQPSECSYRLMLITLRMPIIGSLIGLTLTLTKTEKNLCV